MLDALPQCDRTTRAHFRNHLEVTHFIDRALIRAWQGIADIEPAHALSWLQLRNSYSGGYGRGQADQLRLAILERKDLLGAITDHFLDTLVVDSERWLRLVRFREATFMGVTPAEFLAHFRKHQAVLRPAARRSCSFTKQPSAWRFC